MPKRRAADAVIVPVQRARLLDKQHRISQLLLNKPTDRTHESRFQLIVNTQGNIFDYYDGSAKWDGDIQVRVSKDPGFYTMELSVPLKSIELDPSRERFARINVVRNVFGRKNVGAGQHKETSNWYITDASNLDPQARGWLVFE